MITVIGSLKGGSGKSTLAFNLAIWLLYRHHVVTVYDFDPQATLTDVAEIRNEDGYQPSLQTEPTEQVRKQLERAAKRKGEVLVDVGTSDMQAFRLAIEMADRVVIPIPPSQADVWSVQRFMALLNDFSTKPGLKLYAFINRADTHHAVRETAEAQQALKQLDGIKLLAPTLGQRTLFRRSFSEGLTVFEMEPRSKSALEFQALAAVIFPHK